MTSQNHDSLRATLKDLRTPFAKVHAFLLAAMKEKFERMEGRLLSPYDWLQMVSGDPTLQWIRPMHELLLDLDILIDEEKLVADDVDRIRKDLAALIRIEDPQTEFSRNFRTVVQGDPDLLMSLPTLRNALKKASIV